MEGRVETGRVHEYYCEVLGEIQLTDGDFERGQRLVNALGEIKEVFNGLEIGHGEFPIHIWRGGLIVIQPSYTIERTIVKSSDFYPHLSPNERSVSDSQVVVKSLRLAEPRDGEDISGILIEARSPEYESPSGGPRDLEEVYRLDITKHRVAIHLVQ